MRVGLIMPVRRDIRTGGQLYNWMLVDYLRQQGDHVDVIELKWHLYDAYHVVADNLSRSLFRRLVETPFDVLLQDEADLLFWVNRRLRHRVHYPIISIVHHLRSSEAHPAWQNIFYRWLERRYLSTVDGFILNSNTTHRVVESFVVGQHPIVVAYPGGDRFHSTLKPEEIAARAHLPGPLRILFLGNLIPRKELHTLLAALMQLPEESWRLEIVGSQQMDLHYVASIHRQIGQGRLENRVTLSGAVSDAELAEKLSQSQLLAVPSSYEGFGIVYVEAMGFGLPVIASTAGGASEIVDHTRNGYLVSPGDVRALAKYVYELSRDRDLLERISLAAHGTYNRRPTWSECTRRIREFLESLVGRTVL